MIKGIYMAQRGSSQFLLVVLMLFGLTLAGLSWVGMGIVAKERWPIRWLEVNGSFQRVSAEQLRTVIAPMVSSSYFTLDINALHQAAARFEWVSAVSVTKQWPDTVSVMVHEHVPVAHWNGDQLISEKGLAFQVTGAYSMQGLPWLTGPESRLDDVLQRWSGFSNDLGPLGLEIHRLTLDERGAWSFVLNSSTLVQLGREATDERMGRLLMSWPAITENRDDTPQELDFRYSNGIAVAWREEENHVAGNTH